MDRTNVLSKIKENRHMIKNDLLSGITVALALIPESVAFAFVAGVSPILSLQTAVMIGIIAALFTGRPGMISSSTAAIAVVFAALIRTHGLDYLFATVVLMGIIQLTIGFLRLGKFARIIPHPVMLGFLNGLSIVIFLAQWDQFKVNQTVIVDGVETVERVWLPSQDLLIMLGFVLLTMFIIYIFPKITRAVPSSLIAIIVLTVISVGLARAGYHLQTVQDFAGMELQGTLPRFYIPRVPLNWETLTIIAPYAFIGGLVGLTEAVLTLRVIDEMTNTRGRTNKEIIAQGLANFVNGFFGGMGGDAMIGQSIINVKSGGRTRLSALAAPITLLIFMLVGATFVNAIPLAGLVGVMFMVVVGTFKWQSLKFAGKIPRQDILVILTVTVLTVILNLATAVLAGVILSALMFAWEKGRVIYTNNEFEYDGSKIYKINGSIFFGSVLNFRDLFTIEEDPDHVIIDFKYAKVMDHSAIEAIHSINERYADVGKKVTLIRLSEDCKNIFANAKDIIHVDIESNEENPSKYSYV